MIMLCGICPAIRYYSGTRPRPQALTGVTAPIGANKPGSKGNGNINSGSFIAIVFY
ncbi:MAG: hypothetical protein JSU03_03995 [Bacteroidetes bacterium]|nr:hypothetical protein [Bacteroidota bacterium]MBS1756416.1 hypothetical protein [Bacteroidota bacterium]